MSTHINGTLDFGDAAPLECVADRSPEILRSEGVPLRLEIASDARNIPLNASTIDLIVTSPPYWQKRDYETESQIGKEKTPTEYVGAIMECLDEWARVLRPTGSIFLNIGDSYSKKSLVGIPWQIEARASSAGWTVRNRIVWAKSRGMPEAVKNRLATRHEYIIHLVKYDNYYYDLFGYANDIGNGTNPGDVWYLDPERNMGSHLAPFPKEIARRAIILACPLEVCNVCGSPRHRIVERTCNLDMSRVQACRAMELAARAGLTEEHIRAIQATGVSDSGKALLTQNGTGRNSQSVRELAMEAKAALGGYFREFTFARRESVGWTDCRCPEREYRPGVVLDPFMGTGTTLEVANSLRRSAIGVDLKPTPS